MGDSFIYGVSDIDAPFSNYSATSAPTVNDDSDEGYAVGSDWVDVSGGTTYKCVDSTVGAAIWNATTLIAAASVAEIDTGTNTSKYANADNIAGSYAGAKTVEIVVVVAGDDVTVGDDKIRFIVPDSWDGMNLTRVAMTHVTAGTTNTCDVQLYNLTDSVDMLSTKLTTDSTEKSSRTATTPAVIDTTKDDLSAGDEIRIDVDAVHTTEAKGLNIELEARLP